MPKMQSYRFWGALLNFNVYMDDSGSGGGLFDLDGNLTPPTAQPVVNVSAVVIREDYQPTVEAIWAGLRKRIADEIGIIDTKRFCEPISAYYSRATT
jgi:hypothetical protein